MMEIRKMTEHDIDQLAQMEKMCFADPWSIAAFEYELRNPISLWLVCVQDRTVLGYIGSQTVMPETDIMNIAVLPEYRKQGIGARLLLELIAVLKNQGVCMITLEVRASNLPAICMYKKLGFSCVGRRPGYYRHPKEDACIYRKELF